MKRTSSAPASAASRATSLSLEASRLRQQNRFAAARDCYEQALALAPERHDIRFNFGNLLQAMGERDAACAVFRQVVAQDPTHVPALVNLARLLPMAAHAVEIEQLYRQALTVQPDEPRVLRGLAMFLQSQQRLHEARPFFERALVLAPDVLDFRSNFGVLLTTLGEEDAARAQWRHVLQTRPQHVNAINNLGAQARKLRKAEEAEFWLSRAYALQPDEEQRSNLAQVLMDRGQVTRVLDLLQQGEGPTTANAWLVTGFAQVHRGDIEAGMACFQRSAELSEEIGPALSNTLFASLYRDHVAPADELALHATLAEQIPAPLSIATPPLPALPPRLRGLRVGFLSADLRSHPVACFFAPLLAAFDPARIEAVCYSVTVVEDAVTERIRRASAHWRACTGFSDAEIVAQVRADGCDILVDMAGHTAANRLGVFRARPAPVQMTYMGYPATTGLPEMDYLVADATLLPPDHATGTRETVLRLPRPWICYEPLHEAPAVAPTPCLSRGRVRFGSLNNYPKLSAATVALWARVLHAVPTADMRLHALAMADPAVREQIITRFEAHGIARSRILASPPVDGQLATLSAYSDIDIALDPLPFNGFTTTCDALWMGVPVITLAGKSYHTRVGAALLTALGETDCIACSEDDYVRIAGELASDPRRLAAERSLRRQRFQGSPLGDAPGLAAAFSELFEHANAGRINRV